MNCEQARSLLELRPLELLEQDQEVALLAHLSGCTACAAEDEALRAAYSGVRADAEEIAAAPSPAGAKERAVEAGLTAHEEERMTKLAKAVVLVGPSIDPARIEAIGRQIALACSYCHARAPRDEVVFCAACLAPHHDECWRIHGRCSLPGCAEVETVRPGRPALEPARPRRLRGMVLALGFIGAGGVAALTATLVSANRREVERQRVAQLEQLAAAERERARRAIAEKDEQSARLEREIALREAALDERERSRAELAQLRARAEASAAAARRLVEAPPPVTPPPPADPKPAERPLLGLFAKAAQGGLEVTEVLPTSAAGRAGIQVGDLLTDAAREDRPEWWPLRALDDLRRVLEGQFAGDDVLLVGRRGEQPLRVAVRLGPPEFERDRPDTGMGWYARGMARARDARWRSALEAYDHALVLEPRQGQIWFERGNARVALSQWREAVLDYDRAMELDANAPWTHSARTARDRAQQRATDEAAAPRPFLGLSLKADTGSVAIDAVLPISPAGRAGLEAGDVLESVGLKDGRVLPLASLEDLSAALADQSAGDEVVLVGKRGAEPRRWKVLLEARPPR